MTGAGGAGGGAGGAGGGGAGGAAGESRMPRKDGRLLVLPSPSSESSPPLPCQHSPPIMLCGIQHNTDDLVRNVQPGPTYMATQSVASVVGKYQVRRL